MWPFKTNRVTMTARIIHEMCCFAHHTHETFGSPLHSYFRRHPMLKSHRAPTPAERDQVHIFRLTDGRLSFEVMVCDGQQDGPPWVAIAPGGDFQGVKVQSGRKGRYMVRMDRHTPGPHGRLAPTLAEEFIATYDAINTGT